MLSLSADLSLALRQLRRSPGFAFMVILTLALGIGMTTAVYSLVEGVLLAPLPLPHSDRLVAAYTQEQLPNSDAAWEDTSYPDYIEWETHNHTLTGLAAISPDARLVSRADRTSGDVLNLDRVSANYFRVLEIQPVLGRDFAPADNQAGHHVVILSYGYWRRTFGGDPHILGTTLLISDQPYTVIGIMPRDFVEPQPYPSELWTTFAPYLEGSAPKAEIRTEAIAEVLGRLRPGTSLREAQADLSAIQSALAKTDPALQYLSSVGLRPKLDDLVGAARPALLMLMAAVFAVLLIVCTNVAGLMLSRTIERRGEMALRAALGASRLRTWRQLMVETLLLGAIGGAVAIVLAWMLLRLTLPLMPTDIPRIGQVGLNGRVLAFTAGISFLCALLSSLSPAWRLTRTNPMEALREHGQHSTAGRRTSCFQNSLAVIQTALGVALLIASGFLIRGFINVREVHTGFRSDHVLAFGLPLTEERYPDAKKVLFYNALLPRLAAIPGVASVSAGHPLPLRGGYGSADVEIDGKPNPPRQTATIYTGVAEPGLFETLGIPLLRGRLFTGADNQAAAPAVAIVNEAFVRGYFPGEDPIGRHIRPDLRELRNQANSIDPTANEDREIVGVVADTEQDSVIDPPEPMAYFPFAQASALMRPTIVLRVTGDPMQYERSVLGVIRGIDPSLFLLAPRSMEMQLGRTTSAQRFETLLIAAFAAMALLLSSLGLYSVMARMVTMRAREIGLRMAIGARPMQVAQLVLQRGALLLGAGAVFGIAAAVAACRIVADAPWSRELLFRVSWFDPETCAAMAAVLALVSFSACLIPILRALRVSPVRVLRDE